MNYEVFLLDKPGIKKLFDRRTDALRYIVAMGKLGIVASYVRKTR